MRGVAAYLRHFKSTDYDVVHIHYNPDLLLVAWASRLTRRKPLVLTRHVALPWSSMKSKLYSYLYDRIIPVSDASYRRLLESGVPDSKMTVAKAGAIPIDVVADRNQIRSDLGLDGRFCLGFFGRLAPEKGVPVLLEAIPELKKSVQVCVFGDGPLRDEVESAVHAHPDARYFGFREDVGSCMAAMDAIVIPSTWEEAFPYSALEAMSVARPIVASNIGGLPELVCENENGLLFSAGNVEQLVAATRRLVDQPNLGVEMGVRGREIQRAEYTVDRMAERIEAVYSRLLEG
jgi:glycosyltransferase involved in cell wall biosynthesis